MLKKILIFVFFIIILLLNKWLLRSWNINFPLVFLSISLFFIFTMLIFLNNKLLLYLSGVIFLLLCFYQVKTTNLKYLYSYTPSQNDTQIKRVVYYPSEFTRLGYILEFKKETLIFYKIQENFFNMLDPNQYFPDYFFYSLLPFAFVGLMKFIDLKKKFIKLLFIISSGLITILGVNSQLGPIILFPFINLFAFLGCLHIFKLKILP
jgi:hypothetical protein